MNGVDSCRVRNRVGCFHQLHSPERQRMTVLGYDKTIGNVAAEDLLDNLSHLCARFSSTDDDETAGDIDFLFTGNEDVVLKLKKFAKTRGRIRRIQRRFPDQPR